MKGAFALPGFPTHGANRRCIVARFWGYHEPSTDSGVLGAHVAGDAVSGSRTGVSRNPAPDRPGFPAACVAPNYREPMKWSR